MTGTDIGLAEPPGPAGPPNAAGAPPWGEATRGGNGGVPARRAIVRWAFRLFRREWRQQGLILGLLTVSVAAALFAAVAAYNVASTRDDRFGTADNRLDVDVLEPSAVPAAVAAARDSFGTVDVIGRRGVDVPGSNETLEVRAQDPHGPYGRPMLHLLAGRYPTAPDEVALTDRTADLLGLGPGDHLGERVDLGGTPVTVVGRVENPADLDDEFALTSPLDPAQATTRREAPQSITFLLRDPEGRLRGFGNPEGVTPGAYEQRGQAEKTTAALVVLVTGGVALLLVGLVAAAGFVVVAQRRLRQLGMLAAVGATQRHLRLVTVANGVAVGLVAAVVGTATALLAWLGTSRLFEVPAGHRIAAFDMPWWLPVAGILLAVASATVAAWLPARSVARASVVEALSGRPPTPRSSRRSALAAAVLLAAGVTAIAAGTDPAHDEGNLWILPGIVATALAVLLMAPTAVRALGAAGGRAPVGLRLAWRDLARYRARSGAALAAASLGLGIAVTVVVIAGTARHRADEGNLAGDQLLVTFDAGDQGPDPHAYLAERSASELTAGRQEVERLAAQLDATAVPLEVAVAPGGVEGLGGDRALPVLIVGKPVGPNTTRDVGRFYVATPELLDYLGLDASAGQGEHLLTTETGPVAITGNLDRAKTAGPWSVGAVPDEDVTRIDIPRHGSAPHSLLTEGAIDAGGWTVTPGGWLLDAPHLLTADQVRDARDLAAQAGLAVESREQQAGLATLRTGATAAGVLLALSLLAMTIGLIRSEADRDARTLTAVGAPRRTRRAVTAGTAGGLALLAALLGTVITYLAVGAGYWPDTGRLTGTVPVPHMAVILVGLPALATTAGWLLGGREPPALRQAAIE